MVDKSKDRLLFTAELMLTESSADPGAEGIGTWHAAWQPMLSIAMQTTFKPQVVRSAAGSCVPRRPLPGAPLPSLHLG